MLRPINPPGADQSIVASIATQLCKGLLCASDKLKLDTDILYSNSSMTIPDLPFGGLIGAAVNTVDKTFAISITQNSPGQNLLIPSPSVISNIRHLILNDNGTASFTCLGSTFSPGTTNLYIWNTSSWNLVASNNQAAVPSFNVYEASTSYTVPLWNSIIMIDTSGVVPIITLPPVSLPDQGKILLITRKGSNVGNVTIIANPLNPQNIIPFYSSSITNQLSNLYESLVIVCTSYGPAVLSSNKIDPIFTGSTPLYNGSSGWVLAPSVGEQNNFLRGDCSWKPPLLAVEDVISNTVVFVSENKEYHVNTVSGPCTINLPLSPVSGSIVRCVDVTDTWGFNSLTIVSATGDKINGMTNPLIISSGHVIELYYDKSFSNWVYGLPQNIIPQSNIQSSSSLQNKHIFIGNEFNVPTSNEITGDVTLANNGVVSLITNLNLKGYPTLDNNPSLEDNSNKIATTAFVKNLKSLIEKLFNNIEQDGMLGTEYDVNTYDIFKVSKVIKNISLTLPSITYSKWLLIVNNGTSSFKVNDTLIKPNCFIPFLCNGAKWISSNNKTYSYITSDSSLHNNSINYIDSSNHSLTLSLPSESYLGDKIKLIDIATAWGINNINIKGRVNNMNKITINSGSIIKLIYDINLNQWICNENSKIIPNMSFSNYSQNGLNNYIKGFVNKDIETYVVEYDGLSLNEFAYLGGVYSPLQNRIYMVPFNSSTTWYYIDCNTGLLKSYVGYEVVLQGYAGGVYSPLQNRIYFIPFRQSLFPKWHYIDCNTGNVIEYLNNNTSIVNDAYFGGVYSPLQNRIYMVPYGQSTQAVWHYIDCNTGDIVGYSNNINNDIYVYKGGVYSPLQNRIYFIPNNTRNLSDWQYIDCSNGEVISYPVNITLDKDDCYIGGVYSPLQNRIYMVPFGQSSSSQWHYIDCNTGDVIEYKNNIIANGYSGGVYSPLQNRIYLVPNNQASESSWHYIDCNTGNVVTYQNPYIISSEAYFGGIYSPLQNRIYLIPYKSQSKLHYLQILSSEHISTSLMAGSLFNKL